ncbi:MAG: IS4 family transposase [Gammaproteobacteria bacterium]
MPRTPGELPKGPRITDHISLGVVTKTFPAKTIDRILEETGRQSQRQRSLPARVMVYYAIALAFYAEASMTEVLRCLMEGLRWLARPEKDVRVSGKSGISQARTRLGEEPVRALYRQVATPIADARTKGAWYRGWRLVSIDGSTWDVADTPENAGEFGRPGASRGKSGYPQLRFVTLVESGTHVLFGAEIGDYGTGETTLARSVVKHLTPDMLCLADRGYVGFELWCQAAKTGAALLWRVRRNQVLPCIERLEDGSYLSKLYASEKDRRHDRPHLPAGLLGPSGGISAQGHRGDGRTLSLGHHHHRSAQRAGSGTGGALSRTLGNRDGDRRSEDPPQGPEHGSALQDPGPGAPGVLRLPSGPFRRPQPDARSRLEGRA